MEDAANNGDAPAPAPALAAAAAAAAAAGDNNNAPEAVAAPAPEEAAPAAAPARRQDNTPWLEKSPELRWMVAQYAHKLVPMTCCGAAADRFRQLVIASFKSAGSTSKKATEKWKEFILTNETSKKRRLNAIELCLRDINNNHQFVAKENLTRNDINVDADVVNKSSIEGWDEAAPPAGAGGEGGAGAIGIGIGTSVSGDASEAAVGAGGNGPAAGGGEEAESSAAAAGAGGGQQLPALRIGSANNANNAGGGTGSGSKRARAGAGGGTAGFGATASMASASAAAAASADASARGGGSVAACSNTATGSPHHKRQRPGSAGGGAGGKENGGADGAIDSAPSAAASTGAEMLCDDDGVDSTTALGSAGSNFILQLSTEYQERINALLDVMATDEGQAMVQQKGRELNGGAMSVPVSAVDGDPDKNKAYRELESLFDGSSHKLIPPGEFEDIILEGVLKEQPDLAQQAISEGFEWAVGSLDLLFGQGHKRGPQPTHGDCESRPHQYFGSIVLTKDGAEGTEVLDQSQVTICNTAAKLRQHAHGWSEMSDPLVESLDKTPATMELLRDFGQVVSGGQRVCPGMVPQFFTTLLGGSHPHNGPPSETKNRVVLFFTLHRKGMTEYDGDSQHSREMVCMKLYEELRDSPEVTLSTPDERFLLEKFLHYVEDGATRGAQDNNLIMPTTKMKNRITKFREEVKKRAKAVCEVNLLKAELAEMKGKASIEFDEYAALGKKFLACSCTSAEKDVLRTRLAQTLEAKNLILRDVEAKEAELKKAEAVRNGADIEVAIIRSDFVNTMMKDEHKSGLASNN